MRSFKAWGGLISLDGGSGFLGDGGSGIIHRDGDGGSAGIGDGGGGCIHGAGSGG